MTTSEIRALLETLKDHYCAYLSMGRHVEKALALDRVIVAIETLLSREAEALKMFDVAYLTSNSESASNAILGLYKEIRAILEPEEKP